MVDTRLWARLSLDFADNPKIASLSDAAFRTLVEMILWSRQHLTDGVLKAGMVERRWKTQSVSESVTQSVSESLTHSQTDPVTELLTNDPINPSLSRNGNGDYVIHGYLDHQESRASVEARIARNSANGRRGGRPKKTQSVSESVTQSLTHSQSELQSESPTHSQSRVQSTEINTPNGVLDICATTDADCATPTKPTYPETFETFWATYPIRKSKRRAFEAWKRATRRASPEEILAGAARYRNDPNRVDQFTKYAEGWLNGDGWADDPLPQRQGKRPAQDTTSDRVRGWIALGQQLAQDPRKEIQA